MTRFIVEAPRWLFLAILIYAPWAYGSTRPWTIEVLKVLMAAVVLMWLLGCGVRKRLPRLNGVCLCCVLLLLCIGWWMVLNAKAYYNEHEEKLDLLHALWRAAPGSVERGFSLSVMQRLSGLLGILCFSSDLMQRPKWRERIWWTIGLTGVSLILFGLVERIAGAPMIFWERAREGSSFFGTYFYRANAGAFINLVLPLVFGLAMVAFRKPGTNWQRTLWAPAVLICLAGAFVNTSRGAQLVTAILSIILISWRLRSWFKSGHLFTPRTTLLYCSGVLIALCAIGALASVSVLPRWARFSEEIWTGNGRLFAFQVCRRMIPDVGAFGFGPGTFQIGFPFYITPDEIAHIESARQHWRYAHEDYLQTLIEWGWVGAPLWAVLFGGGMVTGLSGYFRGKGMLPSSDRILLFTCSVALIGVALHSLADFPLQIASLQLYASACLGTCWGSRNWLSESNRRMAP